VITAYPVNSMLSASIEVYKTRLETCFMVSRTFPIGLSVEISSDAVPVYTETAEGIEVSVFTSGTSTLYLATYSVDGEVMKLEKLALGVVDEADPTKLVAKLTAADITGKTVKAFHWTNGLQPIAMKVYGAE